MKSLGRLGCALSAAGLAAASPALADSARTTVTTTHAVTNADVPADMPVEPIGNAAPMRGGWTRDGWADGSADAGAAAAPPPPPPRMQRVADAAPPPGMRPVRGEPEGWHTDGPPPRDRRGGDWRDGDRRGGDWRRQTWDGGRGPGYTYRRGGRLAPVFASPRYGVPDWPDYGLRHPGPGQRWVRYYDDAVLLDPRGYVVDAVPGIGWDDDRWNDPQFADRYHHGGRWPGGVWHGGVPIGGGGWQAYPHGGCNPCGGGATVVTIQSPGTATTTTTTTETYVTTSRRVWAKPVHRTVVRKGPTKLMKRNR